LGIFARGGSVVAGPAVGWVCAVPVGEAAEQAVTNTIRMVKTMDFMETFFLFGYIRL
jgi:hypothetical protein